MRASSDYVAGDHRTSGGARRSVPSFPNRLANRDKKKFTNTPSRHGRMRECLKEGETRARKI
jgi:hypothetical protein